jgi:hypothetical protein
VFQDSSRSVAHRKRARVNYVKALAALRKAQGLTARTRA